MIRVFIFLAFCSSALLANEKENYVLYEAITKSYEVLPTVIYPPSGGNKGEEKSFLGVCYLGKKLDGFQLKKGFLGKLFNQACSYDSSNDPFYGKGTSYIIRSPKNQFYLVYYENEVNLDKKIQVVRFRITHLLNIGNKENLFVDSPKGGGTCFDQTLLRILKEKTGGRKTTRHTQGQGAKTRGQRRERPN